MIKYTLYVGHNADFYARNHPLAKRQPKQRGLVALTVERALEIVKDKRIGLDKVVLPTDCDSGAVADITRLRPKVKIEYYS